MDTSWAIVSEKDKNTNKPIKYIDLIFFILATIKISYKHVNY